MTRSVSPRCRALVQARETCRLVCYDTDGSGTPTIGWGHTKGLTRADVGRRTITQAQADALLDADLAAAAYSLEAQIGAAAVATMTDNQHAAMVDFVFNVGTVGPTLRGILKARKFDAVPAELARYVYAHPNGPKAAAVKLNGLVVRRNDEIALWSEDEPGSLPAAETPPAGVLQAMKTPPAAEPPAPVAATVGVAAVTATPMLAALMAAPGGLDALTRLLQAVVDHTAGLDGNSTAAHIRGFLIAAVGILGAAGPLAIWLSNLAKKLESDGAPSRRAVAPPGAAQSELPAV